MRTSLLLDPSIKADSKPLLSSGRGIAKSPGIAVCSGCICDEATPVRLSLS
jgi:hypothetical protein